MPSTKIKNQPPLPTVALATNEYDVVYMNRIVRSLNDLIALQQGPHVLVCAQLIMLAPPQTGALLPPGAVFDDGGTLKIVRLNDKYADSYNLDLTLNSVQVTV